MRFEKGIGYLGARRPRGPGRGDPPYTMSKAALQARRRNAACRKLVGGKLPRTYEEMWRIMAEVALWTHRPDGERESLRALGKRLGVSHVYCWKVARKYRAGMIPMLPRDKQELLQLRDSLTAPPKRASPPEQPFPREQVYRISELGQPICYRCHTFTYNRSDWLCNSCSNVWWGIKIRESKLGPEEIAKIWRLESTATPQQSVIPVDVPPQREEPKWEYQPDTRAERERAHRRRLSRMIH